MSLEYIMNCEEDDLEDKLMTTFSIEYDVFGETKIDELKVRLFCLLFSQVVKIFM
jgi:hypothetical protein